MSEILAVIASSDFKVDILAFFTKLWALFFYVLIGIAAKFGWMLVQGKKISKWYFIGVSIISCFVGYLAWYVCERNFPDKTGYIVPIATLSSEKIMNIIVSINWKKIIDIFTNNTGNK